MEAAGYTAALPSHDPEPEADPARPLRNRFLVVAALAVPVVVLSMVPALQLPLLGVGRARARRARRRLGRWPLHRAAATNLRHGTATMDTLISLGTLAALGWSVGRARCAARG